MIYFTSDLHLNHDRDFVYKARGFNSVYEMNKKLIENWNKTVQPLDEVYLLGDIMLGNSEESIKLFHQLQGQIHIILGNHDTDSRIQMYKDCWNTMDFVYAMPFKYNGYHFFLSHYPTITSNYDYDKPLKKELLTFMDIHIKQNLL